LDLRRSALGQADHRRVRGRHHEVSDRATALQAGVPDAAGRRSGAGTAAAVWTLVGLLVVLVAASAWHLTQGTSGAVFANPDIVFGSRLPRLAAGVAVGLALGVAGLLMQSLARNPLASPDTLGVTAGAYFAVTAVTAFGLSIPFWASGIVAFAGGLFAAGLVLGLAGG